MKSRLENSDAPISRNGDGTGDQFDDLFDPQRLKISQNYADLVGVRKVLTTVRIQKPHRQTFIRIHPDPEFRVETLVLDYKEDREFYLVEPNLGSELPGEITAVTLFTPSPGKKWCSSGRSGFLILTGNRMFGMNRHARLQP